MNICNYYTCHIKLIVDTHGYLDKTLSISIFLDHLGRGTSYNKNYIICFVEIKKTGIGADK